MQEDYYIMIQDGVRTVLYGTYEHCLDYFDIDHVCAFKTLWKAKIADGKIVIDYMIAVIDNR